MAAIHSKNTVPELTVRRLVYAMGFRYRIHGKKLPGKPDLVFAAKRKVIFVHGCFWHRHYRCPRASTPNTNVEFWEAKFTHNLARDAKSEKALKRDGWKVITVWQCELKNKAKLAKRLNKFLTK